MSSRPALDLRFLIGAQLDGLVGGIHIEPNNVPHLPNEEMIRGKFECLDPMWLEPKAASPLWLTDSATARTQPYRILKQVMIDYGFVPCMQVCHVLGSITLIKPASLNQLRTSSGEWTP